MWNIISTVLLSAEILLLTSYIIARLGKKRINESIQFMVLVFIMNLALYLVPYAYKVFALKNTEDIVFGLLECIVGSAKLFLGDIKPEKFYDFADVASVYEYAYLAGAMLALLATISAAVDAFNGVLLNAIRLSKRLYAPVCDIVVGPSQDALSYADNGDNVVLLLPDEVSRDTAISLIQDKYVVLRRNFTSKLLRSRLLSKDGRINIIIPRHDKYLDYIDAFIQYKSGTDNSKDIQLFVEVDEAKAHTIRREVVAKSKLDECIFTFSKQEIVAHNLMEQHPVTEYLPLDFIDEDASVKADKNINIYFIGFTELSQEIYRQSILNNQLVSFVDGEYRVKQIKYYLWDKEIDRNEWNVDGLKHALDKLKERQDEYLTLPDMPYITEVEFRSPYLRDNLEILVDRICDPESYNLVFIDTDNVYRNIDTASRIKSMMDGHDNYHLFVCSDIYAQDDLFTTYYGDYSNIFSHNVVVKDDLSMVAKTINAVYVEQNGNFNKDDPDYEAILAKEAENSWNKADFFTISSNIYSAMNLRTKINLLGLTYQVSDEAKDCDLVACAYDKEDREYLYSEYFDRSKRNSLLAQEHARWNAFYLLNEFMPMKKDQIVVKSVDSNGDVSFVGKNMSAQKHSCLTTFMGLSELDKIKVQLAKEATGCDYDPSAFEVYKYDEMLIQSAEKILKKLNCHVKKR